VPPALKKYLAVSVVENVIVMVLVTTGIETAVPQLAVLVALVVISVPTAAAFNLPLLMLVKFVLNADK
jgi:hypothetical protein